MLYKSFTASNYCSGFVFPKMKTFEVSNPIKFPSDEIEIENVSAKHIFRSRKYAIPKYHCAIEIKYHVQIFNECT